MDYLWAAIVTLLAIVCWVAGIVGLPGNWGMVVLAIGTAIFAPVDSFLDMRWTLVAALVAVAVLGEFIEFVAGAAGVEKLGGARRASMLALLGSIVGAFVGLFVGIPIPIFGSLVGSLLFGGIGAWGGAILGQRWIGDNWTNSLNIGGAAFKGRFLGTLGKLVCGTAILAAMIVAVWF